MPTVEQFTGSGAKIRAPRVWHHLTRSVVEYLPNELRTSHKWRRKIQRLGR